MFILWPDLFPNDDQDDQHKMTKMTKLNKVTVMTYDDLPYGIFHLNTQYFIRKVTERFTNTPCKFLTATNQNNIYFDFV